MVFDTGRVLDKQKHSILTTTIIIMCAKLKAKVFSATGNVGE